MRALCLHNVTHIRDPSIIVYMPTRGCLSFFFFFFFLFLHDALSQLDLGHQNETPDKLVAMVTLGNLGKQKLFFFMRNRLILKVTKFQLPPPTRLGTVVKNMLGRQHGWPCQIGLSTGPDLSKIN